MLHILLFFAVESGKKFKTSNITENYECFMTYSLRNVTGQGKVREFKTGLKIREKSGKFRLNAGKSQGISSEAREKYSKRCGQATPQRYSLRVRASVVRHHFRLTTYYSLSLVLGIAFKKSQEKTKFLVWKSGRSQGVSFREPCNNQGCYRWGKSGKGQGIRSQVREKSGNFDASLGKI